MFLSAERSGTKGDGGYRIKPGQSHTADSGSEPGMTRTRLAMCHSGISVLRNIRSLQTIIIIHY